MTNNLELELIEMNDTIHEGFLDKINGNMEKLDSKYGELVNSMLEQTGKETLSEAIEFIAELAGLKNIGDASAGDILQGKTAVAQGIEVEGSIPSVSETTYVPNTSNQIISSGQYLSGNQTIQGDANLEASNIVEGKTIFGVAGTAKKQPIINVTLTGNSSYIGYISGYGAGIDQNGNLVIWAMSNSSSYEHIYFVASSVIGTKGAGWDKSSHDTSDLTAVPHACVLTGINGYDEINITLNASSTNSSYDYVKLDVTVTGV